MIDPPDVDMEEGEEGVKEGYQQKQITRTPEEIEQRRLHHIFAQNAVCTLHFDFDFVRYCSVFLFSHVSFRLSG